jgi:hypothetical protein
MLDFREVVSHCDLHDLDFVRLPWTYDNKQSVERNVKVRLDCVVATPSWSAWFSDVKVQHVVTSRSDNFPIFLSAEWGSSTRPYERIARYEIMWERDGSLPEEIKKAWGVGECIQNLGAVATTLNRVMSSLKSWSHVNFGVVTKELSDIRRRS